jgi:hypothetical protein
MGGWVMVWWVWFRLRRPAWVPRTIAALTLAYVVFGALAEDILPAPPPPLVGVAIHAAPAVMRLLFLALLIFILRRGIREYGSVAWLVIPAVLPMAAGQFWREMRLLGLYAPGIWHPFCIIIVIQNIANVLMIAAISLLLLRRLLLSVKRQGLMAIEVKQAQEVQQVILPEARITLPGMVIESEYRPSLEVGGDFFQIIPHKTDGSLLIVAGDVTGKGLKAGMLVALLVGAIRMAERSISDPEVLLQELNQRLIGRSGAQATCLAMRIESDGVATLANAGHIAPFLNGEPMPMEGALPLGMIEGAVFSVMSFQLNQGDWLMLMSDGIVEAQDTAGHLFGFERLDQLVRTTKSATEIASAAQAFGQEDDISVISVTRTSMSESAAA